MEADAVKLPDVERATTTVLLAKQTLETLKEYRKTVVLAEKFRQKDV